MQRRSVLRLPADVPACRDGACPVSRYPLLSRRRSTLRLYRCAGCRGDAACRVSTGADVQSIRCSFRWDKHPIFAKNSPCRERFAACNGRSSTENDIPNNTDSQHIAKYFQRKTKKYFASSENVRTFALAFERKKQPWNKGKWSGSSVWLEYMPVTHGVASSSLVRTAKQRKKFSQKRTFLVSSFKF